MTDDKLKPESSKINRFLDQLKQQGWLRNRNWWVDYLFHFTDIKNAVNVLNQGFLYSRQAAIDKNLLKEDSASSQIIQQTVSDFTDHVRFYFKPLTPTAYHTEGFKPLNKLYHDAHCPVPIYFLFNFRKVLARVDSKFSSGSLASHHHEVFDSPDEFIHLPFRDIYHNSPLKYRKQEIINHRHTEVIVPKSISLNYLEYIVCRSQAEYETLYNLLSTSVWQHWKPKVAVSKRRQLFNNEWFYAKECTLESRSASIQFNSPNQERFFGPFKIRVDFTDNTTGETYFFERNYTDVFAEIPNLQLSLDLSDMNSFNYTARVKIDGKLAYVGKYTGDNIPF